LFFDLVFVLALTQLSRGLIQHLSWSGAFQALVLLLALWGVWAHTAGLTDIFNPQRPPIQLVVTASMLGALVLAAVAPEAFGRRGLVFAGAYLAIQLGRSVFVVLVLRGHEARRLYLRQLVWFGASAVPWIAGALTQGSARAALWTLAVIVDSVADRTPLSHAGAGPRQLVGIRHYWRAPSRALPPVLHHRARRVDPGDRAGVQRQRPWG
jgi:low temperature requirement protein LtrA